jgi:hypothetical protein
MRQSWPQCRSISRRCEGAKQESNIPNLLVGGFARAISVSKTIIFLSTKRNYIIRNNPILQQQIDFDSALPQ